MWIENGCVFFAFKYILISYQDGVPGARKIAFPSFLYNLYLFNRKELCRENLVKHKNFYIARYVFDTI